jgi:histidine ammonia-lyase
MPSTFTLKPGPLRLSDLCRLANDHNARINIDAGAALDRSAAVVAERTAAGERIYGVNTGFGRLAESVVPPDQMSELQHRLVLSTAAGVGNLLPDETVRLCLILKINALAQGYSGIRSVVVEGLLNLLNRNAYPCVPEKGSVGASGDLAPLAHLVLPLIGSGELRIGGTVMPAAEGLARIGMKPIRLAAKEGLALINGTQVSTALAIEGLMGAEDVFLTGLAAGALTGEAIRCNMGAFDPRVHAIRRQKGQIDVAATLRAIYAGSKRVKGPRVQDPYSIRCQPQVMGACLTVIRQAAETICTEIAAVTDNPLVFPDTGEIISGGNFHAEPIAMSADMLALAIAEVGALSERRTALLVDQSTSGLPPFLVAESGLNTGFMVPHVTAAALASENKTLAHPASVDSLPTSANQEDHVSMATFAARRLRDMAENTRGILAIELLSAAQGIDLNGVGIESPRLQGLFDLIRAKVPSFTQDRYFAPDLWTMLDVMRGNFFRDLCGEGLVPSMSGV